MKKNSTERNRINKNKRTQAVPEGTIRGISSVCSIDEHDDMAHIPYSEFLNSAKSGDAILFRGRGVACGLLRRVTKSSWDHVGIVHCDPDGTVRLASLLPTIFWL